LGDDNFGFGDKVISNDTPISKPEDDEFGFDGFAQAIAKSIANLSGPEGTTLAITGEWGSGKSSAINLIRHHLKPYEVDGSVHTIVFNPWWFSDEELLTRAFFQHLYAGLGKEVSNEAQQLILSLRKKLSGPCRRGRR